MSNFALMQAMLQHYRALEFHQNPVLAQRLVALQHWQKRRMQHTHAALFAVPNHQLITQYFLTRLYGGDDFDVLVGQFERVINAAKKFERLVPSSTIRTGCEAIELGVLAVELDLQLAQRMTSDFVFNPFGEIEDEFVLDLYQHANQIEARYHQLDLLDQLGANLDRYVRSFVVQTTFKISKNAAQRHHFDPLYCFLSEGFAAIKPLKSAEVFVGIFTQHEREILDRIQSGSQNPFLR
jgi:predicted nucleic acid-binding OB-fold protein